MRGWLLGLLLGLGLILILVATGSGHDNTGKTVRAQTWANDVCASVGAWEGALKGIRKELQKSNYGARNADGGSGDFLEHTVGLRTAVNRAAIATIQTLQRGIKRAGIPEGPGGARAAAAMQAWARQTTTNLLVAKEQLKHKPPSNSVASQAFALLAVPVNALARSVVQGRATFKSVAALDPGLAQAFNRSSTCRRLLRKQP
jgi:hypothetical protein